MSKKLYIVAIDGSEWSERAAARAIHLAEKVQAKVELLTVMNWPNIQPVAMEGMVPPLIDKASEENYTQDKILTPIVEKFNDSNVTVTTKI